MNANNSKGANESKNSNGSKNAKHSKSKTEIKIAHRIPGRIRIKLPALNEQQQALLLQDLQASPEVKKATLRGHSLVIDHSDDDETLTVVGQTLNKVFPEFERWSTQIDSEIAKATADPWLNKSVPLAFVGIAVFTALRDGALLAGESAFALAYIGFDLYWKFQQENLVRKIEKGLSNSDQQSIDQEN